MIEAINKRYRTLEGKDKEDFVEKWAPVGFKQENKGK